jgi:two-component system, LytTR family, sensor kinase
MGLMPETKFEANAASAMTKWQRRLLAFALWTLLAGSYSVMIYLTYLHVGRPVSWWFAISSNFLDFYTWAALSPLVLLLIKRWPIDRKHWFHSLAIHLPASALLSLAAFAITIPLFWAVGGLNRTTYPIYPSLVDFFRKQIFDPYNLHHGLMIYWVIVVVGHTIRYYEKYKGSEIRASQLEAQIAQAQLQALKMQLHPHFLFNTLNAISVLMREDVEKANHVLVRLSELLRLTLDSTGKQEVPLKQELEFLDTYLEIEKTRFQDRLVVRIEIDPATLQAQVPNLLLQPLVENAIRHGVAPRATTGIVEVRSARKNGKLELQVCDNGPGLRNFKSPNKSNGIGLTNTRARLERLYRSEYEFDLTDAAGGGLLVTLTIPYRVLPESPSENGRKRSG